MAPRWTAFDSRDGLCASVSLDPGGQPFLDHHRIDATPVLPGVMGLEAFATLMSGFAPGVHVAAFEDVAFLAPFKFYRDAPRSIDLSARIREADGGGEALVADCRLSGRRELAGRDVPQVTEHFRGRVCARPELAAAARVAPPELASHETVDADEIYRIYFHGPAYRVLDRVWRDDAGRVVGRMAEALPADRAPSDAPLCSRPLLLELCFQAAGVAEIATTGRMGLPSRIARVELPACDPPQAPITAIVEPSGGAAGGERVDAVVVDADGQVLLVMRGYETMALPEPLPDDLRAPLARALGGEER